MLATVVARAREAGLGVRAHLSACFGDPWDGRVSTRHVVAAARMVETSAWLAERLGRPSPSRTVTALTS